MSKDVKSIFLAPQGKELNGIIRVNGTSRKKTIPHLQLVDSIKSGRPRDPKGNERSIMSLIVGTVANLFDGELSRATHKNRHMILEHV